MVTSPLSESPSMNHGTSRVRAITRTRLLYCLTCMAGMGAASLGHAPAESGVTPPKLEEHGLPVLGIYDCRLGAVAPVKNRALAIAVWEDGLVVFSEAVLTGEPYFTPAPLRQGRCDPARIAECLDALDTCGFFELTKTMHWGPDSSFIEIHALSHKHGFKRLASWHDYGPRFGQPDEGFKRVWDCAREAILRLVPGESIPLNIAPDEVLRPWVTLLNEVGSAISYYRNVTKALKVYIQENDAAPPSLEVLTPNYVDKLPVHSEHVTRQYVPHLEDANSGTKECQILIHYSRRIPGRLESRLEWAIYRPSERYPAEFQGHKTYVYGGWAFTLYDQPAD
jgi:hypothetical protein